MGNSLGVVNGQKYILMLEGKYLMFVNNVNLSVNHNLRDITVRETNNWSKSVPGMREWSFEVDALLGWTYEDGTMNSRVELYLTAFAPAAYFVPAQNITWVLNEMYLQQQKKRLVLIAWENGARAWEGDTYLTSLNIDTPNEDSSTCSLSFTGCNWIKQSEVEGMVV